MVNILMATYNGARYLSRQLDSIIEQDYSEWQLYIYDDGSSDSTMTIVHDYCNRFADKVHLDNASGRHLGPMAAFEHLLQTHGDADYFMFADQDDVWLPTKISTALRAIQQENAQENDIPIVVHTDLTVVDQTLDIISPSFWRYSNLRPQLLESDIHYLAIANCLTGCTMMFNRAARDIALPFARNAYMHDAWIGLSVMLNHGKIIPIDKSDILYRQHEANTLGAKRYRFNPFNLRYKLFLAKRSYKAAHPQVFGNILQFIGWKILYFFRLHLIRR